MGEIKFFIPHLETPYVTLKVIEMLPVLSLE